MKQTETEMEVEGNVLVRYRGKDERPVIPGGIQIIGTCAFLDSSITALTIPNGVTTIEELAFSNCKSLKSVAIPESVSEIGRGAFV